MTGYDPAHFARIASVEQRHAWFRARRELLGRLAADLTSDLPDGFQVLDAGCGTGDVLQRLVQACPRGVVIGMDIHAAGLEFARQRTNCRLVVGDVRQPPFGAEFALVGIFDVLEHLEDDNDVLRQLCGLLRPGGVLLLTVPGDPSLWSYFDVSAGHVRRYTVDEIDQKLRSAGVKVEYITPFMQVMKPLIRGYRCAAPQVNTAHDTRGDLRVVPVINEVLYWLLRRELPMIQRRQVLRSGSSILAIARREWT
ncbi:MAG: class I SAM-dependent methyltransferase [Thermomicrobiales bacterium]|nr:class I SAM-dependent methyltransferase [Thermomicrobiales bacterium]